MQGMHTGVHGSISFWVKYDVVGYESISGFSEAIAGKSNGKQCDEKPGGYPGGSYLEVVGDVYHVVQ